MIFTEKEAAAKRCTPMQILWIMPDRDRFDGLAASGAVELNCIGSRCAQWRWYDKPDDEGNSHFPFAHFANGNGGVYSMRGTREAAWGKNSVKAPARGFCGMAGRVE